MQLTPRHPPVLIWAETFGAVVSINGGTRSNKSPNCLAQSGRVRGRMQDMMRSASHQPAPHGAKAAEVYGIVGYLLSFVFFSET